MAAAAAAAEPPAAIPQPTLGDDGIYRHSWYLESFLDMKEDMETAAANGKRLVIIVEQKGCIYCKKVQTELMVDPKINAFVRKHFDIVQVDLWGHKEATDLDGEVSTERKLARKWRAMFTPTILFMPENFEKANGKSAADAAVAIMPGAFGKGTFLALFEWVQLKRYETGEHFQKYVNDRYWKGKGGRPQN
ncbi:MAG: thioredoxin fold domain-containing protein [Rhodospirillales bacterium]|nr:thioredoxin fold domain-containing protein [Rhodospirillales bacterium]